MYPNKTSINSSDVRSNGTIEDVIVDTNLLMVQFRALYHVGMDFITPIFLPFSAFGISSNILNIIVFVRMGVKDNVTVSFLALSVSDMLYLALLTPHLVVQVMLHLVQFRMGISISWLFDYKILFFPFYWYAFSFYETSILITVYISVVRCACVAVPFKVKSAFTTRRAIIAFMIFFMAVFLLRIPMFMKKRIMKDYDPVSNSTVIVYKEVADGGLANKLNDIVSRNLLTWTSFVIVVICLVVMVTKLQTSARFRNSASRTITATEQSSQPVCSVPASEEKVSGEQNLPDTRSVSDNQPSDASNNLSRSGQGRNLERFKPQTGEKTSGHNRRLQKKQNTKRGNPSQSEGKGKQQNVLSSREIQVIRSVVLMASVFVTCQVPLMAYSLARRFDSTFNPDERYGYLFAFFSNLSNNFALVNASINIIVYYNFNSRYRECIKSVFERK